MAYNYEYPYTDPGRFNADWLLNTIKKLIEDMQNFINLNTIKYADPILWDITSQYEANTVVIDGQTGNAYISTQPVPAGVALSDTDYWTIIYNYENNINLLREQIAAANEGTSTTATADRSAGDLVWLNGKLYRIIADMIAGDSYVEGSNCVDTTIEELIRATYYPAQELLDMTAVIDGEPSIITGDVHVYHPGSSTIEIVHG